MRKPGIEKFKYYVGVKSLADIATKDDRICVLNITGNESRSVTPVSHAYSGGNIVFGTSPGRRGQFVETPAGNIPVYNNVREGMEAGHKFNVGVVYLPPSAVRDGVAELIRINPDVEKVIILTEKTSVHDAREIRALGQQRDVDIFGANCLGVADSWNHVRIGGALGGDKPEETLRKGSVAVFSNSGNFTTTIANYLSIGGWGTTTLISSGKDVYINFAVPEFAYAMSNDSRTKAAVLYSEPGGYYEEAVEFDKPVVACVVGRWKANLTRAVGHAGAIAGSGDDARAKEKWFMDKFGVKDIFTPENPVCSKKGAVVTNIAHIPLALTAVMKLNGVEKDFPPEGNLELKPWFGDNQGIKLPAALDIPVVKALSPYDVQIAELMKNVGAIFPRQSMKDCSGSSVMDPKTQVTKVNGISILDCSKQPLESNLCLSVTRELNDENDNALFNLAVAAHVNLHNDAMLAAAEASREAGNAPNTAITAAIALLGPKRVDAARAAADSLTEIFAHSGLLMGDDEAAKVNPAAATAEQLATLVSDKADAKAEAMLKAFDKRGAKSVFVKYLRSLKGHPTADAVLAALTTTVAWEPLMRKRISKLTVRNFPWYAKTFGVIIGASTESKHHAADSFCGVEQPGDSGFLDRHATGLHLVAGRASDRSQPVPAAGHSRPHHLERCRHHLRTGLQGRGIRRRSGIAGARADQQGHDRFPHPHRFRPRRQRLRRHPVPDRELQGHEAGRCGQRQSRHRPEEDHHRLRHRLQQGKEDQQGAGHRRAQHSGREPPRVQGPPGQHRPARSLYHRVVRRARREERVPRLLQDAGAVAVRQRRDRQRVLREHRRRDRRFAAQAAVAALPQWPVQREPDGNGGLHRVPVRPHGGMRGRDRRPHQSWPQHGYAYACFAVQPRFIKEFFAKTMKAAIRQAIGTNG